MSLDALESSLGDAPSGRPDQQRLPPATNLGTRISFSFENYCNGPRQMVGARTI